MHFVLTLHSHLPYLLNHGRWPEGSDWLCEATLDSYLPLLEVLLDLEGEGLPAPLTLGFTPVLANQLASPGFREEMHAFLEQRLQATSDTFPATEGTTPQAFGTLAGFWRDRFERLQALFEKIDGDLVRAFRRLANDGRIELISSAATHGLLPLLEREESVRLQLAVGAAEHSRLFGCPPQGCWLPECAYSKGVENHIAGAGFRYFFIDAHMAEAGESLGWYDGVPHGVERFDGSWKGQIHPTSSQSARSAYHAYLVGDENTESNVSVFVREPTASMQVWSRHRGYPGDECYLEFHKLHWPGGLKFWRVGGAESDLGQKGLYDPSKAALRASDHATHFAGLLGHLHRKQNVGPAGVSMTPFDTELFGHWWFEGPHFLGELFRRLPYRAGVVPVTASRHLDSFPPQHQIHPLEGSWGANGDFTMWLNDETRWTWKRLGALEKRFWETVAGALSSEESRFILAQAARELLLAQSSDWQFMISTGAVPGYGAERFSLHCEDCDLLLDALTGGTSEESRAMGKARAEELRNRDDVFPDILSSVEAVLSER